MGTYQKSQNMKSVGPDVDLGPVQRVKTDGRIGSATPASYLKGGLDVNTNSAAQPHSGGLAGAAASHMGTNPKGGTWSPRVAKARKTAATPRHEAHVHPMNHAKPALKKVTPN